MTLKTLTDLLLVLVLATKKSNDILIYLITIEEKGNHLD